MSNEKIIYIDISIVVYRSDIEMLSKAIKSILIGQKESPLPLIVKWHFVINDNYGIDYYKALFPYDVSISFYYGHGNIGFGSAHNLALLSSRSDYCFIVNPDVELTNSALSKAIELMEKNQHHGLLCPAVVDENDHFQYLNKRYPSIFLLFLRAFAPVWMKSMFRHYVRYLEFSNETDRCESFQPVIATGCFMLVRGDIFRKTGGFDPHFFLYFEDYDLTIRIAEHARVVYEPSVKIIHHGGGASRKGWWHIKLFVTSAFRFFNKHGWKWY